MGFHRAGRADAGQINDFALDPREKNFRFYRRDRAVVKVGGERVFASASQVRTTLDAAAYSFAVTGSRSFCPGWFQVPSMQMIQVFAMVPSVRRS